jgi:uncharacterized membrane protein YbjE (DUF340 family)
MKGSILIIGCFAAGCLLGLSGWIPSSVMAGSDNYSRYVLYLLMFLVGISIGSEKKMREILRSINLKLLLVPLATIVGTLAATALVSLFIARWSMAHCLAVGSGFGYYSLSSILITELTATSLGSQAAAELGTVALMANVVRELIVLLGAPLIVRYFGRLAPICAGGATTMDTTLPVITRYAGKEVVFIAIFHAILVDFSVPFFVLFFCSI